MYVKRIYTFDLEHNFFQNTRAGIFLAIASVQMRMQLRKKRHAGAESMSDARKKQMREQNLRAPAL